MRKRGFTLIELLIVTGMLAMVLSLIVPTIVAVRHKALSGACQNNLRQIGMGLQAYREANNLYLPCRLVDDSIARAPSSSFLEWWCPDSLAARGYGEASGDAEQYFDQSVLECPAAYQHVVHSYGVNGRLVGVSPTLLRGKDPCKLPVVFDATSPEGFYYSDLSFRHTGDANILYADYHVAPRYYDTLIAFEGAAALPGPQDAFTLEGGTVTVHTSLTATVRTLGGAFINSWPIRGYYRLNDGPRELACANARYGEETVVLEGLDEGDTLTIAGKVAWYGPYESNDNSGHVWSLMRGDAVPSLAGYLDQPPIADFVGAYVDDSGRVDIPGNAVIYLFELSGSIDYENDAWADFQDLVVLVTFSRDTQARSD